MANPIKIYMGNRYSSSSCACVLVLVISAGALRWWFPAIVEISAALKPPYVYVILNAIIVAIVASSRGCTTLALPLPLDYSHFEETNKHYPLPRRIHSFSPPPRNNLLSSTLCHRKPTPQVAFGVKAVAEAEENKTLEQTWKMITWNRQINAGSMKKAEVFKDRTIGDPTPFCLTELQNESSLSRDELNHRVEAFINQFKEEMRLQKEESLNKFKEMINSGT